MKWFACALIAVLFPSACLAASVSAKLCSFEPRQQTLFFSNGVGNTPEQAYESGKAALFALV